MIDCAETNRNAAVDVRDCWRSAPRASGPTSGRSDSSHGIIGSHLLGVGGSRMQVRRVPRTLTGSKPAWRLDTNGWCWQVLVSVHGGWNLDQRPSVRRRPLAHVLVFFRVCGRGGPRIVGIEVKSGGTLREARGIDEICPKVGDAGFRRRVELLECRS